MRYAVENFKEVVEINENRVPNLRYTDDTTLIRTFKE